MKFSALSRHGAFVVFLILYGALLAAQSGHGLASGDGHGIVRTTQILLDRGQFEVSRPPGHPTTEFYLFGAAGWILQKGFGVEFGDRLYLICQAVAALATLFVFYELLCRLNVTRVHALLVTICLAFSPQFFSNAVDGEEFVFGLLFLLLAVRLLIVPATTVTALRLFLSIFCYALATGCRPELIFAGFIFPLFCMLHPRLGWKYAAAAVAIGLAAIVLVWLPVLLTQIKGAYSSGMNLWASLMGGGYKLAFRAFALPAFVLLIWTLAASLIELKTAVSRTFPVNFIFTASCLVPLIFFGVFFYYATKPAYVLVALPFLLFLVVQRSVTLVILLTAATAISLFVDIDIFRDRQLVRPFLASGTYFQAVHQKPYYKLNYLEKLLSQCENRPAVIIGNAWPWDFEYHVERATLPLREKDLHGEIKRDITAFFSIGEHCVFLPPDAAYENGLLSEWQRKGYGMKMDAKLYRTLFGRYDVRSALLSGTANVSGVSFNLFNLN